MELPPAHTTAISILISSTMFFHLLEVFKGPEATSIFNVNSTICCKGANLEAVLAKYPMLTGLLTDPSLMNQEMIDPTIISYLRLSITMKLTTNRSMSEKETKRLKKN